ncbi:hypothetical protein Nepgr_007771 [Nepenthes gracilis]|uniref:Uncharacterized protein n=1 Tax=Nepenthes gracilis TaxID=150966 RepID=A0AAD3S8F8_NEPGR|nr:hypothetical protein Nepgr_007771 [Nepenthes gracilis]
MCFLKLIEVPCPIVDRGAFLTNGLSLPSPFQPRKLSLSRSFVTLESSFSFSHFEDFVIGLFFMHAHDILVACEAYLNGAQGGILVKGGVQSVDICGKSCSESFKLNLPSYINTLVQAFSKIGVKDCEKYHVVCGPGGEDYTFFSIRCV